MMRDPNDSRKITNYVSRSISRCICIANPNLAIQGKESKATCNISITYQNVFILLVSILVHYRMFAVTPGMKPVDEQASVIHIYIVVQYRP